MQKCLIVALWLVSFLFIHPSYAENVEGLNLFELIEEAKANNPEIQAIRSSLESAQARISGFRHLKDPLIAAEFAGDMRMYSITQQFPFPTKISSISKFLSTEAEQYESSLVGKTQEIVAEVKKVYAQLFLLSKKIETVEKSIAFLTQLFHVALQNYAIGNVAQTDVLRAQIALAKSEEDLLTLIDEKQIAEARLNLLLNRPVDATPDILFSLEIPLVAIELDSLYYLARTNHPMLRMYNIMVKKASLMISIAKQKYFPDFTVKFTQQEMDHNFTEQRYMIGLTIPLWFWGKQTEVVKEMNAQLKVSVSQYRSAENKVILSVKESKVNVDKNLRIMELYKKSIIPQTEANLKSAFVAYEARQIDFLSLLESERMQIQAELDYYKAQTRLFKAVADLEKAIGIAFSEM